MRAYADADIDKLIRKRVGVKDRLPERIAIEEQAMTSMLFWGNRTDFYMMNGRVFTNQRLIYEDENEHDVRYRVNLIRARVDTAVAKVHAMKLAFAARPPIDSITARNNAERSTRFFDHVRTSTDFQYVHLCATQWAAICGSSFIWCYFDPALGNPTRYYLNDKATKTVIPPELLTPEEQQQKEQNGLFQDLAPGDLSLSVCSLFGFFSDTASRDAGIAGCKWVAQKHYIDKDTIAERFDINVDELQTVEDDTGLTNYEEAIAFMTNDNAPSILNFARPEEKRGQRTLYVDMWERPSKKHPKGRRICWTPGLVLHNGDNPNIADKSGWSHLPVIKVDWKLHPGRFWGVSLVEDMLNPQYYLNRVRSSVQSFVEAHGQPATYVGDRSGLDTDKMTSQVGRTYKVNEQSQFGVKFGPPPQMPVEVIHAANAAESDLNKVASQSEVDASKLPGQVRTGAGMRAVSNAADAGLTIPAMCAARCVRDTGRVTLGVAKVHMKEARVAAFLEDDGQWAFEEFRAMDLVNDIVITSDPDVSDTKSAQAQEMMDQVQAGVFNPQIPLEMRTIIMKGLHHGSSAEWISRMLKAERRAERTIKEIVRDPLKFGEKPYPVFEWQDHAAEINTLVAFMYSPDFDRLALQGEIGRAAMAQITAYWKQHVMFQQQAMLAQMQMVEASKGTPGQKGQASQPAAGSAA